VTTRLLARLAKRVYLTFESSKKFFRNQKKLVVTGNPVRGDLLRANRVEALDKWDLSPEKMTLFVFGGSQGARKINQLVADVLPELLREQPLQVIWSTGRADFAEIKEKIGDEPNVRLFEFLTDMPNAYAAADLVVCRAGATTLAELTAVGRPSVLIPYPFAAAGHQEFNARSLEEAGAAVCLLESELTPRKFKEALTELLSNPSRLREMAKAAKRLGRPDAADSIVTDMLSQLKIVPEKTEALRAV
jgi:UDP-N-acetylglucosamine--N-acetylmuramyl-(pentapeptide) pyrophosphoryl-undecaprenol N-acetylglucosamine transferase